MKTHANHQQHQRPRNWTSSGNTGSSKTKDQYKTHMDSITRQLEQLTLALQASNQLAITQRGGAPDPTIARYCFVCGMIHIYANNPNHCPATEGLVNERLIAYSQSKRRYTLPNGEELPQVPDGQTGGLAAYLRGQAANIGASSKGQTPRAAGTSMRSDFKCDTPHQASSGTVGCLGLSDEYGHSILGGSAFALSSFPGDTFTADPALCLGTDTSNRYNPISRPNKGKQKAMEDPPNRQTFQHPGMNAAPAPPTTTTQQNPKPAQHLSKPAVTEIPPLNNPINCQDGWRASQPSNKANCTPTQQDVSMRDETKKPTVTGPQYHFTSDLQENFKVRDVWDNLLKQKVQVTIEELIGGSPALQKIVTDSTRTRRKYVGNREASASALSSYDLVEGGLDPTVSGDLMIDVDCDKEQLAEFLVHYSSAIMCMPAKKFFAMVTGVMDVKINGVVFRAMIDTGLELNVSGPDIPEKGKISLDFEGMKWSLKGIHGGPERLAGVMTDVPIQLGSHKFPHHVFVC
ncbi:hypothetical protein D9758_016695 [Tetrapyrgos nigripes]|uniref:DUF4100 domain-containing protein n=1 Tax=Tetrapyrgos nigripes TaxID=182062 RepID=A0A8H5FGM1_9AGAR|nr:hypothetical protein D9758_016695 [Tetrapyrgos nigripes]